MKFIKLFEDYAADLKTDESETSHSWTDIRDTIQLKRPFVIIVFRTRSSYFDALRTVLKNYDCIKQTANLNIEGQSVKYPSVFFPLDKDQKFDTQVKNFYERFDIKQMIVGESNKEYATVYSEDGTSSDGANEVVSTLNVSDFGTEEYFTMGSTHYRFIAFPG